MFLFLLWYSVLGLIRCHALCLEESATYDQKVYDQLFTATEISLPISSDSNLPLAPVQRLPDSNCTYQLTKPGWYTISGVSCTGLPKSLPFQAYDIAVETTALTEIPTGAFANWGDIKALHIRRNANLREIDSHAFKNLLKLENLTITSNFNLEVFHDEAFAGLVNVKQLALLGNKIRRVSQVSGLLSAAQLPSLQFIDLRENYIPTVAEGEFSPMENSSLKILVLSSTETEYIHERAFDPLINLEKIVFTQNKLNGSVAGALIDQLRKVNTKLRHLSLAANPLYNDQGPLLRAVALSSITYLDISNNYFLELWPGFFPPMPRLRILDISNIMINNFPVDVINSTIMPQLEELYVSRNNLREITANFALPTLRKLDFSFINHNNLAWNINFNISPEAFLKMPWLSWLSLAGTRLVSISRDTFAKAINLEYLSLRDSSLSSIDDYSFVRNVKLSVLDLSKNNFPIFGPLSKKLFVGLDNLIALDLSYCHITNLPDRTVFSHLKNLKYLSLRMNSIYQIDGRFFSTVPCLISVDLRYNIMVSWNERIFGSNSHLRDVLLDFNHLSMLSSAMLKDFSTSSKASLRGNTIVCDCALVDAVLEQLDGHTIPFSRLPFNGTWDRCSTSNGTIVRYLSDNAYTSKCQKSTWQIAVVAVLLVLIILVPSTYIIYRNYKLSIEFAYLTVKERLGLIKFRGRNVPLDELDGTIKDAFVSYSCEDESFVEKMVYILESEGFDLLLYKRDFNVGDIIPDRILESIESSRKTILVLSESFAKSQWCLWEMYIAQNRSIGLLENHHDPLLLIKKSEIEESIMTPTLKHLLSTRVYLAWHDSPFRQKIFWQQLKIALGPSIKQSTPKEVPS